jgi:hypothetical protein
MTDLLDKLIPSSAVDKAAGGVAKVPAYALVFLGLLIIVVVALQKPPWQIFIPVVLGVLALSGFVIWVIELQSKRIEQQSQKIETQSLKIETQAAKSVATDSPAQAERLAEVRDLDAPIRGVFGDLVGADDVYLVYSSTQQKEFIDQLQVTVRPDEDPAYGGAAEKRATTIPDAIGAGRIQNLLYLGGKRERLHTITSWPDDFRPDYWEKSLVLIGSGKSNCVTADLFRRFPSPYRFTEDFDAIVDAADGTRWPARAEDLTTMDYGLLVKMKVVDGDTTRVYLVIAGVGPYGTLAGCRFLDRQITKVYEEYGDSPFAYVLSVERNSVGPFSPAVVRQTALPIAHP